MNAIELLQRLERWRTAGWLRRLDAGFSERPEAVRYDRFFQTDGGR